MIIVYRFNPPNKYKRIYILINIVILFSIIVVTALFYNRIEIFGIPIAIWWLFNGLWSVNSNWYSWFHRNDKSSSSHGFWLICLIAGIGMSVLLFFIHLLMWCRTPFVRFYLCSDTFSLVYGNKKRTFVFRQRCVFWMMFAFGKWCWTSPNDDGFA